MKPANLILTQEGRVVLVDCGISSRFGASRPEHWGTPDYVAPELTTGNLTPAYDVYGLAVTAYTLLAGAPPRPEVRPFFNGLSDPEAEGVLRALRRGLATDPARRPPSASALVEAIRAGAGASGPAAPPVATPAVAPPGQAPAASAFATQPVVVGSPDASATVSTDQAPVTAAPPSPPVPVDRVPGTAAPPSPRAQLLAAVGLVGAALVVAVVGLGTPSRPGDIPAGTIDVAGRDPAAGHAVALDLTEPIPVTGRLPAAAAGAREVRVSFSMAGIPLGTASTALSPDAGQRFAAAVDARGSRYLVAGPATATIELVGDGGELASQAFPIDPSAPTLSVPGVAGIVAALFVMAYAESLLRTLRRRGRRQAAVIALAGIGGLFGLAVVSATWPAASREPAWPTLAACVLLGAGAGMLAAAAAVRVHAQRQS